MLAAICIALLILAGWYLYSRGEGFDNKSQRASAIREWFSQDKTPTYVEYRDQLSGDIIEYTDLRRVCAKSSTCTDEKIIEVI